MKTGKYTLREFFSDRDLNTIIIPEIQRDYVWRKEQIEKFLDSIVVDFKEFKDTDKLKKIQCGPGNEDVELEFEKYYKRNYLSSNIGFIYAYSDSDYPGSYFLIDGQQRFTTIFITLLVLVANSNDEQLKKFNRVFLNEEKPKLDYRVREASHIFLSKLVQTIGFAKNKLSSEWIKGQSWYLQDYDNDATISSFLRNIDVVTSFLKEKHIITDMNSVNKDFVEYVEDYMEFWYFDTNISEQGEELYIYMNARGESMQDNENLKADLIGKQKNADEKKKFGGKWEEWQDFFWKNRGNNPNADKGFNEFLCCIAGLENYLNQKKSFVKDGERIPYDNKKDLLSMELIEQYWDGFNRLFLSSNVEAFSKDYSYSDWIGKAKDSIWNIFDNNTTNWFANYKDDNRATERNRMVYVWSMLYYMRSLGGKEEPLENIYRTLRLFYVRYNNYDRAVEKLKGTVDLILEKGPWDNDVLNKGEEQDKYVFLNGIDKVFEEWIWKIEDHPLNLNGRDVGGKNCSHLVKFDKSLSVDQLQRIYNSFCDIFPIEGNKYSIKHPEQLLNSLIYTSIFECDANPFWDKHDTGYYERLFFNEERRFIRGLSTYGNDNTVFKTFFNNYITHKTFVSKTKDEIETKMSIAGVNKEDVDSSKIIWALAWYAAAKGTSIWRIGKSFIYNYEYEGTKNRVLLDDDVVFKALKNLVNCKGDVRQYKSLGDIHVP